ncbi:uncharacterized protein isoform X1 [Salmo salar]|uniref:Uncharacterized protein LOC106603630 n=2 Tax=Salmo salar TaxID=8030 RepID=A0A1S3RL70_SALSA|nr:uncharacterized protein LOC106603630 isoform X1 [Salmo salar]XP_045573174.1 uncharacterized protein LOC106603630 isoform X1 [Salmo salar]XP_045573175.1 uncharacterized protein LOC106603630 isoform X1 [Salmo salar]|eukprot:XP_014052993.1 PREDICTED: uncharacterized protein LOC106603630 [Salmo salar]
MIAIFSLQGSVLTIVSVASLSVFSAFCLWCRRKTKIIHEENQIYDPQIFQGEGNRFAVMRSQTVTRSNQIIRELPPTPVEPIPQAPMGNFEPTYVDPMPVLVYQNVDESTNAETRHSEIDDDQCSYENVFPSSDTISRDSDGSDYENSEFLEKIKMGSGDDEPVYVNKTA